MKKIYFLLLFLLPVLGYSQPVLNKFKQKVKDRVEQRTDEGMEKVLDEAENKVSGNSKKSKEEKTEAGDAEQKEETPVTQTAAPQTASFQSYSRYDFVPGEQIVFAEDFAQDVIGEFPLKWATNNRGEAVTIKGIEGKWMRLFKEGHFVSPYIKNLPENFTAEFDVVLSLPPNVHNTSYPDFVVRLMNTDAGDEKARKFFSENFYAKSDVKLLMAPYPDEGSMMSIFTTEGGSHFFSKEGKELKNMSSYLSKPIHFSIWVQKDRFRLWINGEKIFDLPQAVPAKTAFNRLEFATGDSPYTDEELGYYVSNIKFAHGTPDMRSKLITEGKLVTNGILFDVASDKIKPQSTGTLQEIAKVLKENPTVKVKIVGHTDSDGDDIKNLDLSKRRAASVRKALSTEFGIDVARLETDGKGESQPVAENTTQEGKAKNRRVEFIKL